MCYISIGPVILWIILWQYLTGPRTVDIVVVSAEMIE